MTVDRELVARKLLLIAQAWTSLHAEHVRDDIISGRLGRLEQSKGAGATAYRFFLIMQRRT